jgi:mannopine transport system permease protein
MRAGLDRRVTYLLPAAAFLGLFFVLPMATLVQLSLQTPSGTTWVHYLRVAQEPVYRTTFLRSFRLALECTAISALVGYPFAYVLSRARGRATMLALGIAALPLVLNLLTSSYAWLVILQRKGVVNWLLASLHLSPQPVGWLFTRGATLAGMVYVVLPLMIFPVFGTLRYIGEAYVEAARILGAGPIRSFLRVTLPLSWPGVVAGVLLVFISSFGLYLVPELLGGPRFTLLPFLIQQQTLELLNWPLAAALSVILVLTVAPAVVLVQRTLRATGVGP